MLLTPEELMAGGTVTYDVTIPLEVLSPDGNGDTGVDCTPENPVDKQVRIKPLTVKDIQLIAKAARNDEVMTSVLMIQKAVVEPELKQGVIAKMHGGLVRYLVDRINRISGLATTEDEVEEIVDSPIVRAFFILAREFNWTPQQVKQMTVGQILGYLELLNKSKGGH
jgi:hypothetical protein